MSGGRTNSPTVPKHDLTGVGSTDDEIRVEADHGGGGDWLIAVKAKLGRAASGKLEIPYHATACRLPHCSLIGAVGGQ